MTSGSDDWRPTASLAALRARAELLAELRAFFAERGVLEVETPLLGAATVADRHLESAACRLQWPGLDAPRTLYLQTSPEYAMKRLLAAGSGPIYQLCKAVRDGEAGRRHNPEFTILEWYRPGWEHHRLMDEVEELAGQALGAPAAERLSYREAFVRHAGVDPHEASSGELAGCARRLGVADRARIASDDRQAWLTLLLATAVEPGLGRGRPTFVYDYPADQAALARVRPGDPPLAERFELYVDGLELANGFHELAEPAEQRRRFAVELEARRALGRGVAPLDERLLGALEAGLPDCAGVALGVDRLLMLRIGAETIAEVLAFPVERA